MAVFPSFKLTKKGEELLNRCIGEGKVLTFTKIKIGNGVPVQDWRELTDIQSSFKEFPVLETSVQKDQVLRIKAYFDNKGFLEDKKFKEIGVFVKLEGLEGEFLYSYTNAGDTGDIIPSESRGFFSRTLDIANYIGYATNITFNIEQTRNDYDFNTEAEVKVATFLKVGDRIRLWGRLVQGDIQVRHGIVTSSSTSLTIDNGLFVQLTGEITVNTIEDLKNLKGVIEGAIVEVLGYYTAGDGAGHKRVIAQADDGSGVQLTNGLWANRIVENKEFKSYFEEKNIFKKDNIKYYRIPNALKFKNNLFVSIDERSNSSEDLGKNNNISVIVKKINLATLNTENSIELFKTSGTTGYSDSLLYIVNDKLYCMCLKATKQQYPLDYSFTDVVYKKTSDGINWSEEVSIKLQLSSAEICAPSPTRAIYKNGKTIIPCNNDGFIETSDGVNYTFVKLNVGTWENSYVLNDTEDIICFGRNGRPTSLNFKINSDNSYTFLDTSGLISNADTIMSTIKVNNSLYIQSAQKTNWTGRYNLCLNIYDNINKMPLFVYNVYNFSDSDVLNNMENKHSGYSSLEFDNEKLFIVYEKFGDIKLRVIKMTDLFNSNTVFQTKREMNVLNQPFTENNTVVLRQDFDSIELYPSSSHRGVILEKVVSSCNSVKILNRGGIVPVVCSESRGVKNTIFNNNSETLFDYESLELIRENTNTQWKIMNHNKSQKVGYLLMPIGTNIIDLTNFKERYIVINRNSYNQSNSITEIKGFEKGREITILNTSNTLLEINLNIENIQKIPLMGFGSCVLTNVNGRIFVKSVAGTFQNNITTLNTPYHVEKMKQEGVYNDFIAYMDEKTAYDNQQREKEKAMQSAYEDALKGNPSLTYEEFISAKPTTFSRRKRSLEIQEPVPSPALLEFKEKYLG